MTSAASSSPEWSFVPSSFVVPEELDRAGFRLVPLRPEFNDEDYAAWQTSQAHIRDTPGFATYGWPIEMTLAQNLQDLEQHYTEFKQREGFTYSVLKGSEIIGCVYIYPSAAREPGVAEVRSWVRADHAALDRPLYEMIGSWLRDEWPFEQVRYAPRDREFELADH
jgi:hypothetical protein